MIKFIKNIDVIIIISSLLGGSLFFAISALIGYNYDGVETSNSYLYYSAIASLLGVSILIIDLIFTKRFSNKEVLPLLLPIIFIFVFITPLSIYNQPSDLENRWIGINLLRVTPAIYSSLYLYRRNKFVIFVKYLEVVMILFSIVILIQIAIPFIMGTRTFSLGGTNYQTTSYMAAWTYGISLYYLLFGKNHSRFSFTNLKIYKLLLIILVFTNLIGVIIPSGRGAFVLAVVYSFFSLGIIKNKSDLKRYFGLTIILIISVISIYIFRDNPIFISSFSRVTEFIGNDFSINWGGTSGRDIVYQNAIELILEKPLFGYGIFGYGRFMDYPHNLFLELLAGGGFVWFLTFSSFLIYLLYKLYKMVYLDLRFYLIFFLLLSPLVTLMFSGSYLQSPEFWFVIIYIFVVKKTTNLCKGERI